MKKHVLQLTVGSVMLLCCSLPYSWAMFASPVARAFDWPAAAVNLTFSMGITSFCLGGIVSGILQKRFGCPLALFSGTLLMAAGFLTLVLMSSLHLLYLGFGVLLCLGAGILYNGTLSRTLSFYPDHAGRISGILLMSFGCGASVIGAAISAMDSRCGLRTALCLLGLVISCIQAAGCLLLTVFSPRDTPAASVQDPVIPGSSGRVSDTALMLRSSDFWFYFLWTTLISSAALIVVGSSAAIAASMDQRLAAAALCAGLVSIFNGLGRIVFGWILDAAGSRFTFTAITAVFLGGCMLLFHAASSSQIAALMISCCFLGLSYGGVFPCNSAYIRWAFGSRSFAIHFSLINMSVLAAGWIGPMLADPMLHKDGVPASLLMMGITLAAALFLPGIRRHIPSKKKG